MADPVIRQRKITEYKPDPHNANQGTERGQYMIDHSVESVGLARSIVAAGDDTIPAGNKTLQAAVDAGITDVIEVETDGHTLVVVKRKDWETVDDPAAREYAYLDNRAAKVGLQWDVLRVAEDLRAGIDLDSMFFDWELDKVLGKAGDEPFDVQKAWQGMPEFEQEKQNIFHTIKVHFQTPEDLQDFARLVEQTVTPKTTSICYPPKVREELPIYETGDDS